MFLRQKYPSALQEETLAEHASTTTTTMVDDHVGYNGNGVNHSNSIRRLQFVLAHLFPLIREVAGEATMSKNEMVLLERILQPRVGTAVAAAAAAAGDAVAGASTAVGDARVKTESVEDMEVS